MRNVRLTQEAVNVIVECLIEKGKKLELDYDTVYISVLCLYVIDNDTLRMMGKMLVDKFKSSREDVKLVFCEKDARGIPCVSLQLGPELSCPLLAITIDDIRDGTTVMGTDMRHPCAAPKMMAI
jgi:hypothetical protein